MSDRILIVDAGPPVLTIESLRARITALEEENKRLREALEPFAKLAPVSWSLDGDMYYYINTGDVSRAAAALEKK